MTPQSINSLSGKCLIVLSLIALLTVLTGYFQPPDPDEGTSAHIFQISIVLLVPASIAFLATADWGELSRGAQPLAISALLLVLAFGALYYLEHYVYVERYH